jgi:hypothetical protein
MSKLEFLQNLRLARNLYVHHVHTDSSTLDASKIEATLRGADLWLTPSVVKGFAAEDFPELTEEARSKLKTGVERFRRVAEQVPDNGPATAEQAREASEALRDVIGILTPYLAGGTEADHVRRVLKQADFPPSVKSFDFELGEDATGDPAAWIWIIVDDAASDSQDFASTASEIRQRVRKAFAEARILRWPYVRFRSVSEERHVLEATPA